MSISTTPESARPVPPPTKHQLALMIWIAVFPTLAVLNLLLGELLSGLPMILRTLILVTIAVPIVIYAAMPQLHRIRRALLIRRSRWSRAELERRYADFLRGSRAVRTRSRPKPNSSVGS